MPTAPPTDRELDGIRDRADRFIAELDEEYYRHYSGRKDTLDLAPIYERHAELTELATAQAVGAAVDGDRRTRELWRFTCDGYLGSITRELAEREAAVEAELTATLDGDEIPFRQLRPAIANEPDRERRRRLDEVRCSLGEEHLNPIHLESWRRTYAGTRELGSPTYLALHREGFGMELDRLAGECRSVLDSTEALWEHWGDRLFRARIGIGLDEAERFDVARVFRATEWDPQFPPDRMLPALEATLGDLGIDLRSQDNVELDLDQRPLKVPRAYCFPIEVPERVILMIQPIGGPDDWHALFHEAGHAEHYANVSPDLSVEDRRLGDNAVTEGWASLFDNLVDEPAWLNRRLDVGRPQEFSQESAIGTLWFVRRYCAKLLYELELHASDDPVGMAGRYVEILGGALKVQPSPTDFLSDVDAGFYASAYLRSWAFEAQLRTFLREEFGNAWFARREAGSLLRELWSLGQQPTAEELLKDVTGATLELESVAERIGERLR